MHHLKEMSSRGYRVLGVASEGLGAVEMTESQDDFNWQFEGLVRLHDPPKENVPAVFSQFCNAAIKIKLLTVDYPETAMNIAEQVGMIDSSELCGWGRDPENEWISTVEHS
jgi:Ca2+-transporting ATPase